MVFDRVLSAYPTIRVKGGKGAELTIKASSPKATMILGGGEQFYEFPFFTEIAPSFTVEVKHVTEPLEIVDVGATFTSQPLEYRGEFECSDGKLNDIWKASRWAVQICLQTHHLDSPNHQEPISDPGDYLIESMVNYYAFAQPWLARQDIRKFAWLLKDENYHNFHTSYSIAWLQMLMDYYDYTGDKSLVIEMAPYVHELLDTYASWRGKNGIISEAPNYMFMDWVTIGGLCLPSSAGGDWPGLSYGLLLSRPWRWPRGSRNSPAMRRAFKNTPYCGRRSAEAFNRELWVADKGLISRRKAISDFRETVPVAAGRQGDRNFQSPRESARRALRSRPESAQADIVDKVFAAEKPLNTQPWFMHWVFPAIDHAGLLTSTAPRNCAAGGSCRLRSRSVKCGPGVT